MQALVDATWYCPEALQVNYSLPICRGYRQGTDSSCQAHPCLSQLHRATLPKAICFLGKPISHPMTERSKVIQGQPFQLSPGQLLWGMLSSGLPQPMLDLHPKLTFSPTQSCCFKITSIDSLQTSRTPTRISASLGEPNLRHRGAEI